MNIVVIGYASLDFPAVLDGYFEGDKTTRIRQRPADAFPRPGGCALYAARPMSAHGHAVSIVTWVGADEHGEQFKTWTARYGVQTEGIATLAGGKTPIAFMIYQEDGSCGCLFDPGMLGGEALSAQQEAIIAAADLFCFTVGPAHTTQRALALLSDDCKIAWVMKKDANAYPEALRAQLAARADYIFCNRQERDWVDQALGAHAPSEPTLVIETAGPDPVKAWRDHDRVEVPVPTLSFEDASGAGDTPAGGCLASLINGESDLRQVVHAGVTQATELLRSRSGGAPA